MIPDPPCKKKTKTITGLWRAASCDANSSYPDRKRRDYRWQTVGGEGGRRREVEGFKWYWFVCHIPSFFFFHHQYSWEGEKKTLKWIVYPVSDFCIFAYGFFSLPTTGIIPTLSDTFPLPIPAMPRPPCKKPQSQVCVVPTKLAKQDDDAITDDNGWWRVSMVSVNTDSRHRWKNFRSCWENIRKKNIKGSQCLYHCNHPCNNRENS